MSTRESFDAEVARQFRTAQLQRRRWQRVHNAFADMHPRDLEQLLTACRAATEIEYRQSARRMFDVLDRLAADLLPKEGEIMTEGQKAQLLSRAEWHRHLADQARKDTEIDHAAMHTRLAEQLRDYACHGAAAEPKAPAEPVAV